MDKVTSRRGLSGEDLAAMVREVMSQPLSDGNRPIRLRLANEDEGLFGKHLLAQRIDIHETLCGSVTAQITCLSPRSDLPLESLLGVPMEVQLVTDRGGLRRFSVLVTEARAGSSDGGLALFQLTGSDVLTVMEQRVNSRVFRRKSVVEITEVMLREWRHRSASIARTFDFDIRFLRDLGDGPPRYPEREFTLQYNESDAAFLRRLWKRAGIGWRFTSAEAKDGDTPQQRLAFFDLSWELPENAAGPLRFHRDAATEKRDAITLWAPVRQLVPASVRRPSWDYREARIHDVGAASSIRQGAAGDRLAALLQDTWIEPPHTGASGEDHQRLTKLRQRRHDSEGACVHGASGVRDLAAGEWNLIEGQPELDRSPPRTREHLFIDVHHWADNNLPKALDERAQSLLAASETLPGWRHGPTERRYQNRFIAVQRDHLYVPPWNPAEDWPSMPPLTALVVGPKDEAVHCDALGRVKLRFLGLDPQDHAHDHGAGTNDLDSDGAWVRVDFGWAGSGYGHIHPLRVGMEVQVQFLGGDPDRPVVTGVVYNQSRTPAQFSHRGELPGNRYLSGIVTREIKGQRANQLRFDDTPGQISAQLASQHRESQLNLGHLVHPREKGHGEARGQGFELRTDGHGAVRAKDGLLISTEARPNAQSHLTDSSETAERLRQGQELHDHLAGAALQAKAQDAGDQDEVVKALKAQADDIAGPSAGREFRAPHLVLASPAGIETSTQGSMHIASQQHNAFTSGGHTSLSAGRSLLVSVKEAIRLFACHAGMRLIAASGDIELTTLKHSIKLLAKLDITHTANTIRITAKEEIVINGGGSYSRWKAGGIEHGTNGSWTQHAASHRMVDADNMPGPKLPEPMLMKDQLAFTLKSHPDSPALIANEPYQLFKGGALIDHGVTDARGRVVIRDHQPGTPAYTVVLSNSARFDLKVVDKLDTSNPEHQRSNRGYRGPKGAASRVDDYPGSASDISDEEMT